jgi:hypothetical protein
MMEVTLFQVDKIVSLRINIGHFEESGVQIVRDLGPQNEYETNTALVSNECALNCAYVGFAKML